jgi:5-methyltetrahydropteroyltriglutamate--homocysteine methyltransferase
VDRLPLFPTSLIGSLPRSDEVLAAQRKLRSGKIARARFDELIDRETLKAVRDQESAGIDVITSGELGRDNYVSFVADRLEGARMLSMSELLDHVEDKRAFEDILAALDVPAASIRNAICVGRLSLRGSLVADELAMLKRLTKKPVKITMPGPYLLTRSMWLPKLSSPSYGGKEELGEDVVRILSQEVRALQDLGADVIQFDEPVLTEVVFTEGKPRTFMCAALSEKKDPAEELAFAGRLLRSVMKSIDREKSVASLHVCRGNWSKDERILLSGPYTPLLGAFTEAAPDLLSLEFSTPRAGELSSLLGDERIRRYSSLGLGVMNPRSEEVESPRDMAARAEEALKWLPDERLWLNPDCGFATFASRPVNTMEIVRRKMAALAQAAEMLRGRRENG